MTVNFILHESLLDKNPTIVTRELLLVEIARGLGP